jgi:L-malate glycosyltransferase
MRVCIIQPVMKAYRIPFFLSLAESLQREGVDLRVQYGRPWPAEAARGDNSVLPVPLGCETENICLAGRRLLLQPTIRPWWGADLVVVEHANKHLHNHLISVLRHRAFGRLAYWGHGRDRQGDPESFGERIKRKTLHLADWWFAYTKGAASYIAGQGFPEDRITTVQNAVDTQALRRATEGFSIENRNAALARRGWGPGHVVGLYCGSLYQNKKLDFLVDASRRVHQVFPEFRLLVVGGGEMSPWIREQAALYPDWLRYEGPKFKEDKVECLAISRFFMHPGATGLAILDSFAAGLPFLTTELASHGPEIEYLDAGVNGCMSAHDPTAYATEVGRLLSDPVLLGTLRSGALNSAGLYSIESMVGNFTKGVMACLAR